MSGKEKLLIFILASINFTHILDFMIMMPLNPQLSARFHINQQQFNLLVSSYAISACIAGLVAAFFVDKYDRKSVLLFGYIGFIAGTFCCAFAPSYDLLMMARVVAGIFGGLIGAQVLSIMADSFPYQRRATAMGYLTAAFSVASVAGVPLSLFLASKTDWHAPFLLVGCLGLIITVLIVLYIPRMSDHLRTERKHNPMDAYTAVFKNKMLQRALLLSFTLMIGHFSIIPTISAYMVHNVGLKIDQLPYIYFFGGAATLFSSYFIGRLSDKKGKFIVFAIFCSLCTIPVFLITNLPPVHLFVALIVTTFFFIFVSARMIPMQAMVASVVTPQQRGGFMSINSSIIQLGSGLAAVIAGFMISENETGVIQNYKYIGYISIALSIVCILIARGLKPAPDTNIITDAKENIIPGKEELVLDQVQ